MHSLDNLFDRAPWSDELVSAQAFLMRHNRLGLPGDVITRIAKSLVLEAAWVRNARSNKRVRPHRTKRGVTEISHHPARRSIKADLVRMRRAIAAGDFDAFSTVWVEASPAAQWRLTGGRPPTYQLLQDQTKVLALIDAAFAAPDLKGRPRNVELDHFVVRLLQAFEELSGRPTTTRDPITDTFSPAHTFLVKAASVFGLPTSGPSDNARLRRALRVHSAAKTQTFAGFTPERE